MTFAEAKNISVYDLCVHLGAKCAVVSQAKHYALFHAPYREDRHPSLIVDLAANRWRDLAECVGGDAVDLLCRNFGYKSFGEALECLAHIYVGSYGIGKECPYLKDQSQSCILPLDNVVLLEYVAKRAISSTLAKRYCWEAHKVSRSGKAYYTLAFPSRSGGYELRNAGYKGVDGPKDISVVGDSRCVFFIFEGFFDFMSHIQLFGRSDDATYIVLNSTCLVSRAVNYVASHTSMHADIQLWLDNDDAGRLATTALLAQFPQAYDMSSVYAGHNDLNDFLVFKNNHKK